MVPSPTLGSLAQTWCTTCCTEHSIEERCPGELTATGPEQHGWRVNVDTPNGIEAYGVLVAASYDVWRSRILTYPNVLWLVPGGRQTMKFVGTTPQDAECRAAEFIREHCRARGYQMRNELSLAEPAHVPSQTSPAGAPRSDRDAAPRKIRFLPVRFGVAGPHEKGFTGNLSESGPSIITDSPMESGFHVNIELELETAAVRLAGSVVWKRNRPELGRAPGMGIRLDSPPRDYVEFVRTLA